MKLVYPYSLLFLLYSCSKHSEVSRSEVLPQVKISNVEQSRVDTNSTFQFHLALPGPATSAVSISFSTKDGTAMANKDYIQASGTLIIPAGQSGAFISIVVTGDSLRTGNQQFYLEFSNPVNCSLDTTAAIGTIINDGTYLPTDTSGYRTPLSYPGYSLIWNDEFASNSINTSNWTFDIGNGQSGWGNNELEYYTSRSQNVFQSCGNLIIEARSEPYNGFNYTSTRLRGIVQFQFGRIDIRAKLPVGQGLWPALWMLGSNILQVGWPACGETDIMELVGNDPEHVHGSLHWAQTGGAEGSFSNSFSLGGADFSQQFHVFSLLWQQNSISFLVDGQTYASESAQSVQSSGGTWPFNDPFFFIFNVAVGGNWPGPPNGTTVFPQRMFVDYVRVFQ